MPICSRTHLCLTLVIPWTVAHQAFLSMGLSWQKYWSGLPFPPSGDLPNPGIKSESLTLKADYLPLSNLGSPSCSHNHLLKREHFFFLVLSPQDFEMWFCKNYWNSLVISFVVSKKGMYTCGGFILIFGKSNTVM